MSLVSRYLEPALVERLNHLEVCSRSVVEGTTIGLHKSPLKGASIDFRQHRIYVPGDEPRRLDWRVLGRTDRPYIKEYDEETNLRCAIIVDSSGSMGYGSKWGSKFDYAAKLAACLAYLMLRQTESVGLAVFGKEMEHWLAPHGGPMQLPRVIDALEKTGPKGESDPAQAMHAVAERLDRRALVIVLSDLFVPIGGIRKGLAHLRHDRHEVIAIQVVDPDEATFPFRSWFSFRGMEGEKAVLCETALAKKRYMENFRKHRRELEESSRGLGVEFQTLQTDRAVIDALTAFLGRRTG